MQEFQFVLHDKGKDESDLIMNRKKIHALLSTDQAVNDINLKGWVRTKRDSKTFSFIEVNDGSCLANMQIIVDETIPDYGQIKKITTGSAISVWGHLVASKGGGQKWGPNRPTKPKRKEENHHQLANSINWPFKLTIDSFETLSLG